MEYKGEARTLQFRSFPRFLVSFPMKSRKNLFNVSYSFSEAILV